MDEKRCRDCHQLKPVAAFSRDRRQTDGYGKVCKPCVKSEREALHARKIQILTEAAVFGEPVLPAQKYCPKCQTTKPASEFSRALQSKDCLAYSCKKCIYIAECRRYGIPCPAPKEVLDPDEKRCCRCNKVKSKAQDFGKMAGRLDGCRSACKECIRQGNKKWAAQRAHIIAAQSRDYRRRYAQQIKERARAFYQKNRERILRRVAEYRRTHRDEIRHWGAAYREKKREELNHKTRLYYWRDPEQSRTRSRGYWQTAKTKGRHAQRQWSPASLDESFGDRASRSRLERTPDVRVVSPETAAVEAPSLQAVRAFVSEQVSDQEREILEAFADCFSVEGTAELLGITAGEVEATMSAIRARAATLQQDTEQE